MDNLLKPDKLSLIIAYYQLVPPSTLFVGRCAISGNWVIGVIPEENGTYYIYGIKYPISRLQDCLDFFAKMCNSL